MKEQEHEREMEKQEKHFRNIVIEDPSIPSDPPGGGPEVAGGDHSPGGGGLR